RQHFERLTADLLSVHPDLIRVSVDLDLRSRLIANHVLLADVAAVLDGNHFARQAIPFGDAVLDGGLRDKSEARFRKCAAKGGELWTHMNRLGSGDTGVRIAHLSRGNQSSLQNQKRLDAEVLRFVKDQVRQLAALDAPDVAADAVRNRRVDRV